MNSNSSPKQSAPGNHPRDLCVLKDAARYGLIDLKSSSLKHAAGKSIGHVLKKLAEAKLPLLQAHPRALPGAITYYTPTTAGYKFVGINTDRGKRPLQGANLDACLAVRFWCDLAGGSGRLRLEHSEVLDLFGKHVPQNTVHVLTSSDLTCDETKAAYPAVLRVYSPAQQKGAIQAAKNIATVIDRVRASKLSGWISDRDYGVLCLVDDETFQQRIRHELNRFGVTLEAVVKICLAPRAATFSKFLKEAKKAK